VELKERLTREWRADCWKRLNSQMLAAQKRLAAININKDLIIREWASSISRFFEGVERISSREGIETEIDELERYYGLYEIRPRIENEMDDIDFRLKRGSESGRFDQFWDDDYLFHCRYFRSKWLYLPLSVLYGPPEIYLRALKENKNIVHITFGLDFDVTRFPISDLPRVTSITSSSSGLPAIHDGPLFIKSTDKDLETFAKEIRPKLDPSTYTIFTDVGMYDIVYSSPKSGGLRNNARVLISFVAPTSGQSLVLRLKHSGDKAYKEDAPLEVALGSTIQLNPSSNSSLTIDDIIIYPTPAGPSLAKSDHLSFEPGIWNVIFIQFGGPWRNGDAEFKRHGHFLHDIQLLDEAGLEDPRNHIINAD
jgi:hypothetical protein